MRNIFLALVLANLAFAAWHAWFAEDERSTRPAPRDMPGITLVSELPADAVEQLAPRAEPSAPPVEFAPPVEQGAPPAEIAPRDGEAPSEPALSATDEAAAVAAQITPSPAEPPSTGTSRCVSVGPFRDLSQAATAAASLRTGGYTPTQRVAEGDVWIGYWVYIQAIPTEAEANEILLRVRERGVADSYVIPNTDSGNLVSLGVFTEIAGVTRRRDEVRALGYAPTVVDRTRRATVYWVDVLLEPEQSLDLESLQTPGRIIRLEQRACEAPPA